LKERLASKANRIQINELERKIVSLGEAPKNPIIVGDPIKHNDNGIKVLKKTINFPDVQHVQTHELQDSHEEREQLYQQLLESQKIIECLQAKIETWKVQQT